VLLLPFFDFRKKLSEEEELDEEEGRRRKKKKSVLTKEALQLFTRTRVRRGARQTRAPPVLCDSS